MITIAAIITTCNSGAFLEEALASVLAQTRLPDEILVMDDGSTDDTPARMDRWAGRVRYQWHENVGASETRNLGMRATRSSWIAFLDADDLWLPDRLERQENWLREHPETEAVFGLVQNFAQPGCGIDFDPVKHRLDQWVSGMIPSAALLQRAMMERLGGFDKNHKTAEAIDLVIRFREAGVVSSVPEFPVARRRLHGANKRMTSGKTLNTDLRLLREFIARKRAKKDRI